MNLVTHSSRFFWDLPGLDWASIAGGRGSSPGQRTKILHAVQCGENKPNQIIPRQIQHPPSKKKGSAGESCLVSSSFWWLQVFLGLLLCYLRSLPLWSHDLLPPSFCVVSFLYASHKVIVFWTHLDNSDLIWGFWLNYIYRDLFSR